MNNLPLQPLVWFETEYSVGVIPNIGAQGAGIFYRIAKVGDKTAVTWHDQSEGSTGAKELGSVCEAKHWVETDHYPSKMQPYVKPAPTWIDVSERLPEKHTTVLVVYHAHFDDEPITEFDVCTAFFDGETFDPKDQLFYTKRNTTVVRWMPIPEFSTMQNMHKGE